MTYFGVLATFILPPLLVLMVVVPRDVWRRLIRRQGVINWQPYIIVLVHVVMALIYTTPWDNYLVATGVWWYNPQLVTGITMGWVPIEEYTFFVVQTLLSGLWTLAVIRFGFKVPPDLAPNPTLRRRACIGVGAVWSISTVILLVGWQPGTYLTLILSWALIPVLIQLAFGADILLANSRPLLAAIVAPTLYLWVIDTLAIRSGTWSIGPLQTTGLVLIALPVEEMLFFLMTNVIIACGMTLMLSEASKQRARVMLADLKARVVKGQETRVSHSR